jgi:hypothetical protein
MRKIVVLAHGWVLVGTWTCDGTLHRLRDAAVVRRFGTVNGLGELALGQKASTVLDSCPDVTFVSYVFMMDCMW